MVRISNGFRYFTTMPFVVGSISKHSILSEHEAETHSGQHKAETHSEHKSQQTTELESEFLLYNSENWLLKKLDSESDLNTQLPKTG
jgi:hypothetical protein